MKKKAVILALTAAMLTSVLAGCGRRNKDNPKDNNTGMANTEGTIDNTGTESAISAENGSSQLQLGNAVEIPENFDGQLAETEAHERLERVIADYCNVPEEEYANVRYYYNYVDLDGDSETEILALVLGQDVEGIQGNILLWLDEDEDNDDYDEDAVEQAFKQVGTPIYISNHMTGGYRDLIIPNNTNLVMGTEGSGLDTVGGSTGNEPVVDADVTMTGVTGTSITETNDSNGSDVSGGGNTGSGSNASGTGSVGSGSDTAESGSAGSGSNASGTGSTGSNSDTSGESDSTGELGIPLIPSEQQYRLLVWDGDRYQTLDEGTALFSLEGYEGIAILTNNIESDLVNDNYHFLGEAMRSR